LYGDLLRWHGPVWSGSWEGLLVDTPSHRGFRFPPAVISHGVWLYHRFAASLRDVEEPMLERGIEVSHETIHQWTRRFGPAYAAALRHRRPRPADKWHLEEVFVRIQGRQRHPWRAVATVPRTAAHAPVGRSAG
jgi:transposase-like protein